LLWVLGDISRDFYGLGVGKVAGLRHIREGRTSR